MEFIPTVAAKLKRTPHKLYLINSDKTSTDDVGLTKYCKKGYKLKTINSTGHFPMIEKPLIFNELLDEILKEITSLI